MSNQHQHLPCVREARQGTGMPSPMLSPSSGAHRVPTLSSLTSDLSFPARWRQASRIGQAGSGASALPAM
jgi:hypothetical protein